MDNPTNWLLTQPLNNFFLIVVMIWMQTGFAMAVLSAAIKAVPETSSRRHDRRCRRLEALPHHYDSDDPTSTLVVVLTTIMIAVLKIFDIVRTMTGGNFGTSIVANEFYTQTFRQGEQGVGIGAALAVILFVIIIPVIVYNVRQMRLSEEMR